VTYAEYRSLPFESFTPVRGAELFTDTIPHKELFTGFSVGPFNDSTDTTVDRDKSQSISGESFRITTRGNKTQQGVTSNAFKVENFNETKIELNLYRALDVELNALLINNETQRITSFVLPRLAVNQWQRIILNVPNQPILAGQYKFAILQPDAIPAIWWIDNVSIYERSISWAGRAVVDDPWKNNIAPWTPYKDFVNQDNSGVLFAERGNQLQVRARALRQNTRISRVQFKPLYAQLGRLVWPENEIQGAHLISINSTVLARNVRLSYTVVSGNNSIVLAEWNLGDGSYRVGSVIDYVYDKVGTYTVSLITTDKDGFRNIATQQITTVTPINIQGTAASTSTGSGSISVVKLPAVPTGLSATDGPGQIYLEWNANTESNLAGYRLRRDGVQVYSGTTRSFTDFVEFSFSGYYYTVSAFDSQGNESAQSAAVYGEAY
jgi:hypothetical protein